MSDRFYASYLIETPGDPHAAAVEMAGEQSTSTSSRMPGETDRIIREHGARIESLEALADGDRPSLPSRRQPRSGPVSRARTVISWPTHNIGYSLPMLATTLLGNQVGMRRLTGVRLESLRLPRDFIAACPRPAFGIAGTRQLSGVVGRPLIGSIVKPNIGYTPAQSAEAVRELAEGGIDFVKDDELIANPPYSPLAERVAAVMRVVNEIADRTGKKPMYAFNISDEVDEMRRHHDTVLAAGGTCVMVNINSVGLSGLIALRRHSSLPIHGHRAGWAMLTRCPALGMDFQPYQMLHRLAGVDHLHVSGLGGKFWEEYPTVLQSARDCLSPMDDGEGAADDRAMPVFSGGSSVLESQPTFEGAGTADLIYAAGGAVFGHPGGIAAGVCSLRQSWEAAMQGAELSAYAASRPELEAAIGQRQRQLAARAA